MIGKILKSTSGKPCSCPEGKICQGCKKKRILKPQVYVEEPRRLTIPIVINRYKPPTKEPGKKNTLCQWYKRQKARKELKSYNQKEKRDKQNLERIQREREVEEHFRLQAETAVIEWKDNKKSKRLKARTTSARPRADSKFVSVKPYRYDSLSTRFVNCCYRVCCQFYCYLSCILIVGFVLIYFL